ncbi:hypothetical protein HK100_008750 [Physocladia obscura]|uniref:Uncharacterized protein n=1 Tax=Physocladia obscura TaxID=109957 RepID=A0AAD5XBD5_9FUNG|nr:hypothetical protein HK100_008750 [Physocladia obscura]
MTPNSKQSQTLPTSPSRKTSSRAGSPAKSDVSDGGSVRRRSARLSKVRKSIARMEKKKALKLITPRRSLRIAAITAAFQNAQSLSNRAVNSAIATLSQNRAGAGGQILGAASSPVVVAAPTAAATNCNFQSNNSVFIAGNNNNSNNNRNSSNGSSNTNSNIIATQNGTNEREEVVAARLARENCRNGEVQATLSWSDPADLDLHAYCACGAHIYFANKECQCGGWLDRDMNRGDAGTPDFSLEPIENIFWASSASGSYKITVHNFNNRTMPNSPFADPSRRVAFRVRLRRGGDVAGGEQWFEGTVGPRETVECFVWNNAGSGALGRMVVLQPLANGGTFKEMCAAAGVTYSQGQGYYAVARKEDVSEKKDMMLHHIASDTFTIGATACRTKLNLGTGDIKISPQDIPAGYRLFVQSTSHNRKLPSGLLTLMMVPTVEEALRHRRTAV